MATKTGSKTQMTPSGKKSACLSASRGVVKLWLAFIFVIQPREHV